ncbi:hypothetical protein KVR01_012143 [Diaporthe batatas]|uniref:uncharacterized protein n=1 Tax=Diaporthe batatas TaxID=748121 RepID=UPI001D036E6C|nr:uncharacterized protein KVR01_012143 [Diaporthe batatas]KAG8157871.1 hypothetical protein KVR01_012143 [Diaporthe batatas]
MCLDEDAGLTHSCIQACTACYVFQYDALELLADGRSVNLGTLSELLIIANQGCNFCKFLLKVAIDSGRPFKNDARVEAIPVESFNRSPDLSSRQLDKISIRVADPFTFGRSGGTGFIQQEEFHQFSVDLGIFTQTPELKHLIPKFPANPRVATEDVFGEIGTWISECINNHDGCPKFVESTLPTRVLDVGTATDLQPDHVKLHVTAKGECGRYAALSYCWGPGTQVKTLQGNLEEHKRSIRVTQLPQTVQDAIRVTREVGIRYLWVDALCIIQDSPDDDWPREAAQMPEIYKNAMVTISAAAATDTTQGFLGDREPVLQSILQSSRLPVYKYVSDDDQDETLANFELLGEIFLARDENLGYDIKKFDDEAINTRAWCLQESWLSPRLLVFGSGLPRWICLEHERMYGVDHPKDRYDWDTQDKVRRQIFNDPVNSTLVGHSQRARSEYLQQWGSLFHNYTRRNLTFKTDKMAAISGIAKEMQKLLQDRYVAGLWESSLPHSLLWNHVNDGDPPTAVATTSKEKRRKRDKIRGLLTSLLSSTEASSSTSSAPYIAPSWSPFANNGTVSMHSSWGPEGQTLASITELDLKPANPLAPFLALDKLHDRMQITAPMAQMSYEEVVSNFVIVTDGSPHMFWDYIIPDGGAANEHLGHAGELQWKYPEINPQVAVDARVVLDLIGGGGGARPLARQPSERPVPPDANPDDWPAPAGGSKKQADLWLLEISHTNSPSGLVLVRIKGCEFRRIGMFVMARNQDPTYQWVNGYEVSGPRRWDWDTRLRMRSCIVF